MHIIKEKIDICKVKKGNIISISNTNLSYVDSYKIIIKGITFLIFNYSNKIYIKNLF